MGIIKNIVSKIVKEKHFPVHITDGNFKKEILEHKGPVILDIWGPNCVHCKRMEPIILDLATDYHGQVKIAELNAAEARGVASRLSVYSTPTVVVFKNGSEIGRESGWKPKSWFQQMITAELLK
jgi:thioredoxin 1